MRGSSLLGSGLLVLGAIGGNVIGLAAAQPKLPLSIPEVAVYLVSAAGVGPDFAYFAWAIGTYSAAAFLVLQFRGGLKKEWSSIGDWSDRIIVVVSSTAAKQDREIERCLHGQLTILKGRMLLAWPDEATQPLTHLNQALMTIARHGLSCEYWSRILTNFITFMTLFILHLGVAWLLWLQDAPLRDHVAYAPTFSAWLLAIFLWPVAVYLFQHIVLPDWRSKFETAEADMKKLSRQFTFDAVIIGVAP